MTKRTILIIISLALIPILILALYLFQPWKLFTDTTVNEALPTTVSAPATSPDSNTTPTPISPSQPSDMNTSTPAASNGVISEGSFVSQAHPTSGTARILALPDGTYVLRIENLDTDNGPDLKVWLTDATILPSGEGSNNIVTSDYLDLGALKGNKGNQNYPLPAGTNPADYTAVSIWCDRFSVSFGGAELTPTIAPAS